MKAGLKPVFALDYDFQSYTTFRNNFPNVHAEHSDIKNFPLKAIEPLMERLTGHPKLFCGCAPCQPFTKQNTTRKKQDDRVPLLGFFLKFVEKYLPEFVFVENVPGLQKIKETGILVEFVQSLENLGYFIDKGIIAAQDYGVPQQRRRFLLVASKLGTIKLPEETHGPKTKRDYSTVRKWIGHLPPIDAGEKHLEIPGHVSASLSPLNMKRIRNTPPEKDRHSWPKHLRLKCHYTGKYVGHNDVYGRMKWDAPATGLTTRCISLSNGRFGHPEQNRAISIREAASLQTFPENFIFHGPMTSQARQIGNAVPPLLAKVFGRHFIKHWKQNKGSVHGHI